MSDRVHVKVTVEVGDLKVFATKEFPNTDAVFSPEGTNLKHMQDVCDRNIRKLRREEVLGITEASGAGL